MTEHPLIDIREIAPRAGIGHGWHPRASVRVGISGADGASTLAWHAVLPPGTGRAPHANERAEEILIYLKGAGRAMIGGAGASVRAGHCQFVPKGVAHAFVNEGDQDAILVGFHPFAASLDDTGYKPVEGIGRAAPKGKFGDGALVHLDDLAPADMAKADGWFITDFRLPIGRHTGSASTLFRARFLPGAVHKKHRHDNCEEIYFVISGGGAAGAGSDRVIVHGGHFHYVPKGVEHWLSNLDRAEPIEVVGIYIGAGSVDQTGYVYMGDVTADDVRRARGAD